ncbi:MULTISPECIES: hypothetical protein [Marinobacter]|uniref:hypothetical protein n=1 Tax=Marinobacter TaxID=2742 RepID=UPI001245FA38|nr:MULTISPECIES: hypothetical protein [Marinobacter]MBL3554761.1 hypothetical protein [Marinobacter sp. JB05H06]
MTEPCIVGWRLDLARNHLFWGRGRYLTTKTELFALIAKLQSGVMPIEVCIDVDEPAWERYYKRWLYTEGVSLDRLQGQLEIRIVRVPIEGTLKLQSQPRAIQSYLEAWYAQVDVLTQEVYDAREDLLPPATNPDSFIEHHQQSQSDGIVGIWSDSQVEGGRSG